MIKKIEIFDGREDTAKLPEIPSVSRFAALHQRILDARRKLRLKRKGHDL